MTQHDSRGHEEDVDVVDVDVRWRFISGCLAGLCAIIYREKLFVGASNSLQILGSLLVSCLVGLFVGMLS